MKNKEPESVELEPVILQWCYSFDFLNSFASEIEKSPNRSLGEFYKEWHSKCKHTNDGIYPLANTMGIYLGGLYVLLVCAKSSDTNLIPELPFSDLDFNTWGHSEVRHWGDTKQNLRDYVRRLRNSVSHFRISIEANKIGKTIVFKDKNMKKETDCFEVAYSPEEMHKFIFRFAHCIMFKQWQTSVG